jgi:antitoxin component of MazEF toxin-antitoxin module
MRRLLVEIPEYLAEQIMVNSGEPVEVYLRNLLIEQFSVNENRNE